MKKILNFLPEKDRFKINKDDLLIEKNNKENVDKERSMIGWYRLNRWKRKEFN